MNKKDLASVLYHGKYDSYRKVVDKASEYYIHDTQIDAATKIVMQLASNTTRTNHVILVARMQGGKTGAMCATVNVINKTRLYKNMAVNKFFFITGMNDCGLKGQTYDRVINQVIGANTDNVYNGKRSKKNLNENKFFVLKNSDLMSYDGIIDNSVIFIDEAHYGSNEKNVLTKFLAKHGIDWKNKNELISRNIYIVSISATPFDELVSDTVDAKKVIELEVSKEYVGVSEFLKNDMICEANKDDISEEGAIFDYIHEAEDRMIEHDECGIIFIRTRKFDVIKGNPYVESNFNIFEMYASGTKIEYDRLNEMMNELLEVNANRKAMRALGVEASTKPLIVLIKGAFRAGITIDSKFKDIIYMIYDYSLSADATAQAMLGRMCGYRRSVENIDKTCFYLNKKFADMYSSWEKNFGNKELIPCSNTKMEWVDASYEGDDVEFGSRSCGNFTIPLSDEEVIEIYKSGLGKRNRGKIIKPIFEELMSKNNCEVDYDYIGEVHISGKNNYAQSSQTKRFDNYSEDSLVFPFRPSKVKEFLAETNRDFLTREDLGKKCISLVMDATVEDDMTIGGNKRMLVYYVEVGQKKKMFNRKTQYKKHKDTNLSTD